MPTTETPHEIRVARVTHHLKAAFLTLAVAISTPVVLGPAFLAGQAIAATADNLGRQAEALREEILSLQVRAVAVARQARQQEVALSEATDRLDKLETEEAFQRAALARNDKQHRHTLAAIQRLAIQPPAALLARAASPLDSLRGTLLLRAALPEIQSRAGALREEVDRLAALRQVIAEETRQVAKSRAALEQEQTQIAALVAEMQRRQSITVEQQQAMVRRSENLARHAETLRELLTEVAPPAPEAPSVEDEAAPAPSTVEPPAAPATVIIPDPEAEQPASGPQVASLALVRPPTIRSFSKNRDKLLMPVHGKIRTRFGQTLPEGREPGGESRGLLIRAQPAAPVIAPFDGEVVYAGHFRAYGQILIIDHGGRYHSLLAGLDRIDAVVGQWVLAGEPVAILDGSPGQRPELYLELRHKGESLNPLPLLASF